MAATMRASSDSACSRGFLVMRPTIPGMPPLVLAPAVPGPTQSLQRALDPRREHALPPAVEADLQPQAPEPRQRHEIARRCRFLEAAAPLELGQRIVTPVQIDQIRQALLLTELDALGDQRVVGRLVPMRDAREDLSGDAEASGIAQHHEADELVAVVRADHVLPEQAARELLLDRVEVLAVVPEAPPLPHRRLVEDRGHPAHELVV